jgi:hypothetical protein
MKKPLFAATLAFVLAGCATIFNGQTQSIPIKSTPEGAAVEIKNGAGAVVFTGKTPAVRNVSMTLRHPGALI